MVSNLEILIVIGLGFDVIGAFFLSLQVLGGVIYLHNKENSLRIYRNSKREVLEKIKKNPIGYLGLDLILTPIRAYQGFYKDLLEAIRKEKFSEILPAFLKFFRRITYFSFNFYSIRFSDAIIFLIKNLILYGCTTFLIKMHEKFGIQKFYGWVGFFCLCTGFVIQAYVNMKMI